MYQRLQKLYKKLDNFREDEKILKLCKHSSFERKYIQFDFISSFGIRKVVIGYEQNIYHFSYKKYIQWTQYIKGVEVLFTISTQPYTNVIQTFCTDYDLTVHDIDMAIYEIEEYIRSKY